MIMTDKLKQIASCISKQENEIIIGALASHFQVSNPNPYDYLNRMSKNENRDGKTVYLDGKPLVWFAPTTISDEDDPGSLSVKVSFRLFT